MQAYKSSICSSRSGLGYCCASLRSICISTATHRPLNACASKQLPCSWSAPKQSSLGCQQGRLWQLQSDGRSTRTRTYARRPWAGDLEDTPKLIKTRKKHSGGKPHPPSPSPTSKADQEGGEAHSSGHNSRERGDTKHRSLHDLRASSKSTHRPHSKTVYMHQQTMRPRELGALSMEELQALVEQITHSEVLPAAEVFKANTQVFMHYQHRLKEYHVSQSHPAGVASGTEAGNPQDGSDRPSAQDAVIGHQLKMAVDQARFATADDFTEAGDQSTSRYTLQERVLMMALSRPLEAHVRDLDLRESVTLLYRYAKGGAWPEQLLVAFLQHLEARGGQLLRGQANSQSLGNLAYVITTAAHHADCLSASAFVERACKSCGVLETVLQLVQDQGPEKLGFTQQEGCSVLHACGYGIHISPVLVQGVADKLVAYLLAKQLNHLDLSCMLLSLGQLQGDCGYPPQAHDLQALQSRIAAMLERQATLPLRRRFNAEDLSSMLVGLQRLDVTPEGTLLADALADECVRRKLKEFSPVQATRCAWALASMGRVHQAFFATCAQRFIQPGFMARAAPQSWSNGIWAFASVGICDKSLCQMVQNAVCTGAFAFQNAQQLSNTVWALARMGALNREVCERVSHAVLSSGLMHRGSEQAWANMLWALSVARYQDPLIIVQVAAHVRTVDESTGIPRMQQAPAQACGGMLASLAHLGADQHALDVDSTTYSRYITALLSHLVQDMPAYPEDKYDYQPLSNSLWALAVLGQLREQQQGAEAVLQLLLKQWQGCGRSRVSEETSRQLWSLHVEAQRWGISSLQLPVDLLQQCREAALQQAICTLHEKRSDLELRVERCVSKMDFLSTATTPPLARTVRQQASAVDAASGGDGLSHDGLCIKSLRVLPREECLLRASRAADAGNVPANLSWDSPSHPDEWLMAVDIVVEVTWQAAGQASERSLQPGTADTIHTQIETQTAQVCIEVDGPSHFLVEPPRVLTGPTRLRNQLLLQAFGGRLVCIPYWEWLAAKGAEGQGAYLMGKLLTVL